MSYWSSAIGAEDRWHLSIDTVQFSGWISLRLGKLCISTKVLCAATSELDNSSSYSVSDWTKFCENDLAASAFPLYVDDWALQESKWRNRPLQSSQDIRISAYPTTGKLEGQSKDYWAEGGDTVPQNWDRGSKFIAVLIFHHLLLLDLLYMYGDHICELWKEPQWFAPNNEVSIMCPVPSCKLLYTSLIMIKLTV